MQIKLTNEEKNFLLDRVNLPEKLRKIIIQTGESSNLEISEDDSAEFSEACSNTLELIGFDENDEPTIEGIVLEKLIDKFYC